MAKLEGVKTLDMVNGEITKVEYNGEVYERVGTDSPKVGDIGMIIDAWGTLRDGDFYKVTEIRNIGYGTYHHLGEDGIGRVEDKDTMFFRKPSAPTLKAGDKIRMIENCPSGGYFTGDTFEVIEIKDDYLIFVDNDDDIRHVTIGNDTRYELVPKKQEELFAKVNRPNNVPIPGDYVEFRDDIAEECSSFLTVGKKYKVERVDYTGGADITDDNGDFESAEPYETKAIYVKYTQEQAEKKAEVGDKILVVDAYTPLNTYENGDIFKVKTERDEDGCIYVEEHGTKMFYYEYIVLNPEQVGEATEGEKQPEIDSEDLPVGTKVRGKGTGVTYTLYGRSPEYDGNYGKAYYVDEDKIGWIGEEQLEVISKPETIEVGDLVQVIDSPSALPNGSYFVVKGVSDDGSILRGVRPDSVFDTDYRYATRHVKLIAKAGKGEGDRFYG